MCKFTQTNNVKWWCDWYGNNKINFLFCSGFPHICLAMTYLITDRHIYILHLIFFIISFLMLSTTASASDADAVIVVCFDIIFVPHWKEVRLNIAGKPRWKFSQCKWVRLQLFRSVSGEWEERNEKKTWSTSTDVRNYLNRKFSDWRFSRLMR